MLYQGISVRLRSTHSASICLGRGMVEDPWSLRTGSACQDPNVRNSTSTLPAPTGPLPRRQLNDCLIL